MFEHTTGKHPVVLLHDVRRYELEALLSYMYAGIVSVAQRDLARLIKVAELLQIKGLAVPDELPSDKKNVINSHNTSRDSISPKSKLLRGTESSDDRSSPHPKRRRREESGSSPHSRQAPPKTPDSPSTVSHDTNHDNSKISYSSHDPDQEDFDKSCEGRVMDDLIIEEHQKQISRSQEGRTAQQRDQQVNDRYLHQSVSQDPSRNQIRVKEGVEDAIVIKEEAWEDTSEHQREDVGGDYMGDDTASRPGDTGQEDPTSLLMAKDYEGQVHQLPPALPEVVVEALAGPSGMHQWLGGSDFGGVSGGTDNYGGDGGSPPSSDPSHLQQMGNQRRGRPAVPGLSGATRPRRLSSSSKLHQCTFCSYATYRKDHLKIHIRTHTGERPYGCPHCPSRFIQTNALRKHLLTHSREKTALHRCILCPFSTSRKDTLILHMCSHAEEKSFPCKYCNVQFADIGALQVHIRTHAQEKLHQCSICPLTFKYQKALKAHMLTHHQ
ncbi:hypothetical protein Pmani_030559 [Petrolisthes manimaculis]|uniref:C2H2-type domain-containing protein n=1 Tax=Petrolisthes manimaculis TaxID=1843537 RepID=A0AAE1NXM2_9EUCA|nr:hypothetical protein Pmani_030559 [Petrolisthes manimaculis]